MKRHSSQLPAFESQCKETEKPLFKIYRNIHSSLAKQNCALLSSKPDQIDPTGRPRRAKSQQATRSTYIIFCGGRLASIKRSFSQDHAAIHGVIRVKTVHVMMLQKDIQTIVEGLQLLASLCRNYGESQKLLIKSFQSQVVATAKSCRQLVADFINDRRTCFDMQDKLDEIRKEVITLKKNYIFCNESLQQSKNKLELLKQTVERKRVDCMIKQQIVEVNQRRLAQKLEAKKTTPFRERTNTNSESVKLHTVNESSNPDLKSSSSCAAGKAKTTGSHHLCSVCSSRSSREVYSLNSFDSKNLLNTKIFNSIT